MMQDHLEALARESEESIAELNSALLALESQPRDDAAMDDVFRVAHTLKGNFAAAGFDTPSEIAHALEDLLDAVRQGDRQITPELMDLAFEAVDLLSLAVEQLEDDGEVTIEAGGVATAIRRCIEADVEADTGDALPDGQPSLPTLPLDPNALEPGDGRVIHVRCSATSTEMPSVDCVLALETLGDAVPALETHPSPERIESEAGIDAFDALVVAANEDAVRSLLEDVGRVTVDRLHDVTDADGGGAPDFPTDAGDDTETIDRRPGTGSDEVKSVRVDVEQLDDLYGLVEGLVTSRIKLRRAIEAGTTDTATRTLDELEKITTGLQNTVMDMRLIPLRKVVHSLPRLVRDLSREQDKDVEFDMSGTDIELDRSILTQLGDPLVHIVRNAIDHGIEPPDEREAAGKERTGHIVLEAERERDHVLVTIEDDGRGLDRSSLERTAVENGLLGADELEDLTDEDVYELIFHPGFSTADEVTDVSGRGVGMDVVHETVRALDGSVGVSSTAGKGTTVRLRLPVNVAIVKALFLRTGGREFGIPLKQVDEVGRDEAVSTIQGRAVIEHDEALYPVVDLADALSLDSDSGSSATMFVRIRAEYRPVALRCDRVVGQEEVVVKPLEGLLANVPGLGGTAVLGDGDVVPILDIRSLDGAPT